MVSLTTANIRSCDPGRSRAFPTEFRSSGVGMAASFGRLGSVTAPLLVSLVQGVGPRASILAAIGAAAMVCAVCIERTVASRRGAMKGIVTRPKAKLIRSVQDQI